MKLITTYDNVGERDYVDELLYLETMYGIYALPPSFYTRSELANYKVQKYRLIGLINREQEYDRANRELYYSSRST